MQQQQQQPFGRQRQQWRPAQQAPQPPQPLPAEVNILAVQNSLGKQAAEYKARLTVLSSRVVVALTLAGVIGGVLLILYNHFLAPAALATGALGVVLLLAGIWLAVNALLYYGTHVYVFAEGLVRVHGNRSDVLRWDQVKTTWQKVNKRFLGSFYIGTVHSYIVQRDDGKKFKFNDGLGNVEALGNTLIREVNSRLLPQVISTYETGETVSFGKLSVTIHGISNGDDIVLWNQLKDIQVNKGVLTINKDGQWVSWPSIKVSREPNFPVFMALVNYVRTRT